MWECDLKNLSFERSPKGQIFFEVAHRVPRGKKNPDKNRRQAVCIVFFSLLCTMGKAKEPKADRKVSAIVVVVVRCISTFFLFFA